MMKVTNCKTTNTDGCAIKENHYRSQCLLKTTNAEYLEWIHHPYTQALFDLITDYTDFSKGKECFPEIFIGVQSAENEAKVHFAVIGKN